MSKSIILKIQNSQFKEICNCFTKDYTASVTAQHLGLSRQTINRYYKIIRTALICTQDRLITNVLNQNLIRNRLVLRYMKINKEPLFYVEDGDKTYFLEEFCVTPENFHRNISDDLKMDLFRHTKANSVRIFFNKNKQTYSVLGYFSSNNNEFQNFVYQHLKQFRGLNKEKFIGHIKESQLRFNYSQTFIFKTLISIHRL